MSSKSSTISGTGRRKGWRWLNSASGRACHQAKAVAPTDIIKPPRPQRQRGGRPRRRRVQWAAPRINRGANLLLNSTAIHGQGREGSLEVIQGPTLRNQPAQRPRASAALCLDSDAACAGFTAVTIGGGALAA